VAEVGAEDVDRAATAARSPFELGPWRHLSGAERGNLLNRLADLIEKHSEELAYLETLDSGKPLAASRAVDLPLTVGCYRYYAGWADKIQGQVIPVAGSYFCYTRPEPIGVVGQNHSMEFSSADAGMEAGAGAGGGKHRRA
jgi:aldehyde dehydrogenase (NAD+)